MAKIQYFLGAYTPAGFHSLYHELIPPKEAEAVYILKGGPGCGKSTPVSYTHLTLPTMAVV